MSRRVLTMLLCLLAVAGFAMSLGCSMSERDHRRNRYVIDEDLKHMRDDFIWAIGQDEPSIIYEDSIPPGP